MPELVGPGKKLRWIALFALAVVALAVAGRRARPQAAMWRVAAAGTWLACLALASTAWSVDERLTFGRAGSFALLLGTAAALGIASAGRPELRRRLLLWALAGTAAAAFAGLIALAFDHANAVQPASTLYPARFRGLGENPDTLSMLEGLMAPAALWALFEARTRARQLAALAVLLLLLGSITASGSRGGLLAALVGGVVLSVSMPRPVRQRLAVALCVCAALAGATAVTRIPKPLPSAAPGQTGTGSRSTPSLPQVGQYVGPAEIRYSGRLADELYRVFSGTRSLLSSSGRLQAWYTAIQQADARPALGYGFGTEDKVFIDRVYNFDGSYVENSFVGFYLQLGAVGIASAVALLALISTGAVAAVRYGTRESTAPAYLAVLAGGISLMLVQSYVYSVGNVATATFWVAGFVAVGGSVASQARAVARERLVQEGEVASA